MLSLDEWFDHLRATKSVRYSNELLLANYGFLMAVKMANETQRANRLFVELQLQIKELEFRLENL